MPMQVGIDEKTKKRNAIVDGILAGTGLKVENPAPGYEDFRGAELHWLCREVLKDHYGTSASQQMVTTPNNIAGNILNAQFAMGVDDFDNIFLDVAHKNLRIAYREAPKTFESLVSIVSGQDFKDIHGVSISGAPELDLLDENGEYKAGYLTDSSESYSIQSYGKMIYLSRKMIVNNDMKAFLRLPRLFGNSAARKESDIVWSKITGNPTMSDGKALFHADHSNLESTGTPLSSTTLTTGRKAMRKQTGLNGAGLDIRPRFVIVPASLEGSVEILIRSTSLPEDNKSAGVHNPWQSLIPISEPRLDDDSETAWYLSADPAQVDIIEMAYLGGRKEPYVDQQTMWKNDAIGFKCRHEFGVGLMDYRGLYKNPGA